MTADDHAIVKWEVIKNELWFAVFTKDHKVPGPSNGRMYLNVDKEIIYENFYQDFGPHHLNNLFRFCGTIRECRRLFKVVFYTHNDNQLVLNALYLLGGYLMIYENKKADWIMLNVKSLEDSNRRFRTISYVDASIVGHKHISLKDVLKGLEKAFNYRFFNFKDYNYVEYEYHEKVVNGDLNWILPGKLLAFSGPHSNPFNVDGYNSHSPSHYYNYFWENNVTTIVRLNTKNYDACCFTMFGFEHFDLFFVDGSSPTHEIMYEFLKICEQAKGAVAVHCKAGLGRTGTLIACYIMKHYNFTAKEAVAWLRICRPGSVIGGQVAFLQQVQKELLHQGQVYRQRHSITTIPKFKHGIYSIKVQKMKGKNPDVLVYFTVMSDNEDDDEDELENEASVILNTSSKDKKEKMTTRSDDSTREANKRDFVSLDSIIKCDSSAMKTRSSNRDKKNKILSSALTKPVTGITTRLRTVDMAASKPVDSNKNENSISSVTTRLRSSDAVIRSSAITPTKSSLAKCRIMKSKQDNINNNNCRVTRQNNENISLSSMMVSDKSLNNNINKAAAKKKSQKKEAENNSDSERDSTTTILTNISADSLENIPCKIAVTCAEPMDEGNGNEDGNSQGNRLYQIKALRRKLPPVLGSKPKGRIQTRSLSNSQPVKKK